MRPITVFRPFEEEVRAIIPLVSTVKAPETPTETAESNSDATLPLPPTPLVATIGRGYRSLVTRYTDIVSPTHDTVKRNIYALLWRGERWTAV